MNVLIVGAGASRAASGLPTALTALGTWQARIREHYPLLGFSLEAWVGNNWPTEDLETAWTKIDLAWKERVVGSSNLAARDLTDVERRHVWQHAFRAADAEPPEPVYYRPQIQGARDLGHSTEQFLSVVAGWELRRLVQQTFVVNVTGAGRKLYRHLLERARPAAIISFNYDTLVEQCLPPDAWTYVASEVDPGRILVLKPHGSVNWIHRYPRIVGAAEQIDYGVTLPPDAMGYRANWLVQNAVIGLRTKLEHTAAEGSAAIRSRFREILMRCEDVLATAERICVVGYRFAAADTGFLDMLARAVARRRALGEMSVIGSGNPDHLLPRIRDLFAFPADQPIGQCFHGLEVWAAHGFHGSD